MMGGGASAGPCVVRGAMLHYACSWLLLWLPIMHCGKDPEPTAAGLLVVWQSCKEAAA